MEAARVPGDDEVEIRMLPDVVGQLSSDLDHCLAQLDAIAELLDTLRPEAERLDSFGKIFEAFGEAMQQVSPEDLKKLDSIVQEWRETVGEAEPDDYRFPPLLWLDTARERFGNERWISVLHFGAVRSAMRVSRSRILHGSILVSAVGAFELLVGSLVRYFYSRHPGALSAGEEGKEFSLADLEGMSSIEEARSLAIERRVERVLFDSLSGWSKWMKKSLDFSFEDLAIDWTQLREAIERRHVVVHNGGRASRIYLERLGDAAAGVDLGDPLLIDEQYLLDTLRQLRVVTVLAVNVAIIKLDTEWADYAVNRVTDATYDFLVKGEDSAVIALCDATLQLRLDDHDKLITRVNRAVARKRSGDDEARHDLDDVDRSALDPKFQLAIAVIEDDLDLALDLADELFRSQGLDLKALLEWPLLVPLRGLPKYRTLVAEHHASLLALEDSAPTRLLEVSVSPAGTKYHLAECRHCSSDEELLVPHRTAVDMGYAPCGVCRPPRPVEYGES